MSDITPKKIVKPERERVADAIRQLSTADSQLAGILSANDACKACVSAAYDNLYRASVGKVLATIDIEELNRDKLGIRISALKNVGFKNIGQLVGLPPYRLMSINGIGEDSAHKIARKVQELSLHAQRLAKVQLSVKDKNHDATEIVTAISVMLNTRQSVEWATTIYSGTHNNLSANIATAKKLRSHIRWWFTSNEKKGSRIDSLVYLESLIDGGFAAEAQSLADAFKNTSRQRNSMVAWDAFEKNNAPFYALLEQITGNSTISEKTFAGLPEELVRAVEAFSLDISLMKATLRGYQVFGTKYLLHQNRTLLGDEMGLGKTIQAIAAMAHLAAGGKKHFAVVAPVSVMINWMREVKQHSELEPIKLYGDYRQQIFDDFLLNGGVAVTTYETISRIKLPENCKLDMLIVDEAHYVKNPEAIRTRALQKLAGYSSDVVFMTGTPLEK